MVDYARDRYTSISTNGSFLSEVQCHKLLDSGLDNVIVCLDGASQEIHATYRVGSDFKQVRDNLERLCRMKRAEGNTRTNVALQFLVFKHNVRDIDAIRELADTVGVDQLLLKRTDGIRYEGAPRYEQADGAHTPSDDEFVLPDVELDRSVVGGAEPLRVENCKSAMVLWNGDVVACCEDFNGETRFGNAFTENFREILNGPNRRRFMEDRIAFKNDFCAKISCPIYKYEMC